MFILLPKPHPAIFDRHKYRSFNWSDVSSHISVGQMLRFSLSTLLPDQYHADCTRVIRFVINFSLYFPLKIVT